MIFDIAVGIVAAMLAYRSAQYGALAAVGQLLIAAVAAVLARIIGAPTASFMLTAIEWSPSFAMGAAFLLLFGVFFMVGHFIGGRAVEYASDNYGDGGGLDQWLGFIIGAGRAALIMYCVLASVILLTQRLASERSWLAFQYQKSRVGAWVLGNNLVDPEPFPNARALLRLVDVTDGSESSAPNALAQVANHPKVQALMGDVGAVEAIRMEDWKALRKNPNALELVTDQMFIAAANEYRTVRHKVSSEEPTDRFDELDTQREEIDR